MYICSMIVVTGGTGLTGSHLLLHLTRNGHKVKALIRKNASTTLVEKVFERHGADGASLYEQIIWREGDLLDIYSLLDLLEEGDKVYHTAAMVSFEGNDHNTLLHTNITGTANLVNAALEKKVGKLCHVSSIAALGRASGNKLIDEETHFSTSVNPSVYSISKFESEREVWRGMEEGLKAVIVNPSVILGAGDWSKGSSKLFETVYRGLRFYTEGVNGYVDVRDLVEIMIRLMESDIEGTRFIVSAENISYRDLFNLMAQALHVKPPTVKAGPLLSQTAWRLMAIKGMLTGRHSPITRETAKTAQQVYRYDNTKLLKTIDFAYTPIAETIRQTAILFLKEHGV